MSAPYALPFCEVCEQYNFVCENCGLCKECDDCEIKEGEANE
jgi:Fe2+ or Zn2+ uptake regulation protein